MKQISNPEENFALILKEKGLTNFRREYRFHAVRRWRFDFAFPEIMTAIEIEGILFHKKAGHQTGVGFLRDCEKYFVALMNGWEVIRIPGPWVMNLKYWHFINDLINYLKGKIND